MGDITNVVRAMHTLCADLLQGYVFGRPVPGFDEPLI